MVAVHYDRTALCINKSVVGNNRALTPTTRIMAGLRDSKFKGFRQVVPDGQYEVEKVDVAAFNGNAYVAVTVKQGEVSYELSLNSLCLKVFPVPDDGEPVICSHLGAFNTELAEAIAAIVGNTDVTCGKVADDLNTKFKGANVSLHSVSHTVLTYEGGTIAKTFYSLNRVNG